MNNELQALVPCPFCRSTNIKAHAYGQHIGGEPDAFCQCHDCSATGPSGKTEAEAIAAWNRRADTGKSLMWTLNVFEGAPPEPHASWHNFLDECAKTGIFQGLTIRRSEAMDTGKSAEPPLWTGVAYFCRSSFNGSPFGCNHKGTCEEFATSQAAPEGGKSAEADDADRLFVLLAEIRAACGDNGKRMQDELVEYIAGLARSANRWQLACAYEDNAGLLYCAVINNAGDMAAINAEFDADAIDTPQASPQADDRNWQLREGDPFKSEI